MTRDDGQAMLDAGAALLQVYTGYIYAGPALVADLNRLVPHDDQGEHPMTSSYGDRLSAAVAQRGPLCVGIDPHPAILKAWGLSVDAAGLERCARGMVEALGETVRGVQAPVGVLRGARRRRASRCSSAPWPTSPPRARCRCWT